MYKTQILLVLSYVLGGVCVCVCVISVVSNISVSVCYSLSRVRFFVTPWTVAHQAPLSMGFPRQEYWNELSFLSPGDLPDTGVKPGSPALQVDSLPSEPPGKPPVVSNMLLLLLLLLLSHFSSVRLCVTP